MLFDHDVSQTGPIENCEWLTTNFPWNKKGYLRQWELLTHVVTRTALSDGSLMVTAVARLMLEICIDMVKASAEGRTLQPTQHPRFDEVRVLVDANALNIDKTQTVMFDQNGNMFTISKEQIDSVANRGEWVDDILFEFLSRAFDTHHVDVFTLNPLITGRLFAEPYIEEVRPKRPVDVQSAPFTVLVDAIRPRKPTRKSR